MNDHYQPAESGFAWLRPTVITTVSILAIGLMAWIILGGTIGGRRIRETTVHSQSSNNIKQLALALHNFESAYGRLPPAIGGTPSVGAGILVENDKGEVALYTQQFPFVYLPTHGFLLPYMENEPLFKSMGVKGPWVEKNQEVTRYISTVGQGSTKPGYQVAVRSYCSPADPSLANYLASSLTVSQANWDSERNPKPSGPPSGATSYAANFKLFGKLNIGDSAVTSFDRGMMIADIPNGSSNMVAFAEKYGSCTAAAPIPNAPTNQGIPVQPRGSGGSLWGEPNLNENAPFFAYPQGGNNTYTAGEGLKFQIQPNPPTAKCNPFRASTPHVGGILVGLADGSVRTVSPSISAKTWYRAVTPEDKGDLGADW